MRSPGRMLTSTVLVFEALVVFFAGLVAKDLSSLPTATALWWAAGLALACLITAGFTGRAAGRAAGWLLQAALIAVGFWVPAMFFLGAVFLLLWITALRVGARYRPRPAVGPDAAGGGEGSPSSPGGGRPAAQQ